MKNFVRLNKLSLLNRHYTFVDTRDYLADQVFINNKLRVHFGGEMCKDGEKYIFVLCHVRKRDAERFELSMKDLRNKMLLLGNNDYLDFCDNMEKLLHMS